LKLQQKKLEFAFKSITVEICRNFMYILELEGF